MAENPKHPLERTMKCAVCAASFPSIPVRRGATPGDFTRVLEQHVCPNGHVYVTEIGAQEMLAEY